MRNLGFSNYASVLTGFMVIFENALACQSRLILLDSFLVFFTGLTALMWSEFLRFKNEYVVGYILLLTLLTIHLLFKIRPFSVAWWRTLTFVGISLGLTVR